MSVQEARLYDALAAALDRFDDRVGVAFPAPVKLNVIDSTDFYAAVYPVMDDVVIDVTTGVVDALEATWRKALAVSAAMPEGSQIELLGDPEHTIDISLRWLMQHELNHYAIGHFALTGGVGLFEAGSHSALGVVTRFEPIDSPLTSLKPEDRILAPLCLELQTDHDATEIVLGAYSRENWILYRYYATCILAVILIIEREERGNSDANRTHPWAETRLFMLLAHLVEMPMIPAYFRASQEGLDSIPTEYLPNAAEIEGYSCEVISPVFAAATIMADIIGLPNFWSDIGSLETLWEDIDKAVQEGVAGNAAFKTRGAQQWASLKPLNDKLLRMLNPVGL